MKVTVKNPYYEKVYESKELDIDRWKIFVENHERGNEVFISFMDELTDEFVMINPANFASVEVAE